MRKNLWPNTIQRLTFISLLMLLLTSCNSGSEHASSVTAPSECSDITEQNRFVLETLQDRYYWYQELPQSINPADFSSPAQLLDFVRFNPPDRYSGIVDQAEFDSLISVGQYIGLGFSFVVESNGEGVIRFVYDDSPAGKAGLQRGDRIIAVNGESASDISNRAGWNSVFSTNQSGVNVELSIRHSDLSEQSYALQTATVQINTVLDARILQQPQGAVAYLAFKSFLSPSFNELQNAFAALAPAQPRQMIVDLRYNGGGLVSVAQTLASYLAQPGENKTLVEIRLNDKHSDENETLTFSQANPALALDEVLFITTASSCSASELVINALKPYVPVRIVGSNSCGKPVGFYGRDFCGQTLLAVEFALFNANGEGDYFDGLGVDCAASDDLTHALGDSNEAMLGQSLELLAGQSCSAARRTSVQSRDPFADSVMHLWGRDL